MDKYVNALRGGVDALIKNMTSNDAQETSSTVTLHSVIVGSIVLETTIAVKGPSYVLTNSIARTIEEDLGTGGKLVAGFVAWEPDLSRLGHFHTVEGFARVRGHPRHPCVLDFVTPAPPAGLFPQAPESLLADLPHPRMPAQRPVADLAAP